jgi:hypothetical protein
MTHLTDILDKKTKDAALTRIGYSVTTKRDGRRPDARAILEWFVTFANEDLTAIDPEEPQARQDEYRALQEQELEFFELPPGREQLSTFQTKVKQHLTVLDQTRQLLLGPFSIQLSIFCPLAIAHQAEHFKNRRLFSGEHYQPVPGEALIYLMGKCLQLCGDLLKRCLYCQRHFLQQRRVGSERRAQKYCSHLHRTQASKKRAAEERESAKASTKRRGHVTRRAPRKGRRKAQHGTKAR